MHTVRSASAEPETPVLRDAPSPDTTGTPAATPGEPTLRLAVPPAPRPAAEAVPLPSTRRPHPWLLVVVEDDPSSYASLLWALREAARREATVVAVSVDEDRDADPALRSPHSRQAELDAQVERATVETGVSVQVRTAVLDAAVLAALTGAASGADLVVVGASGKRLLRPAVPRTSVRGIARGA
jgi:nucleotide-binding universal stress UspA family protein